jgi:hypothetical protein
MPQSVTFETQCYENDYEYVLDPQYLKKAIQNCNFDFAKRTVLINKVNDRKRVAELAERCVQEGAIDAYYFADDYVEKALAYFDIDPASFKGGYYYSRCQLIGLMLSESDYQLHFTADTQMEDNTSHWIKDAIALMQADERYVCATPLWYQSYEGAEAEAVEERGDWFAGYGFSDNCYLVPTKLFKQRIYGEYNQASDRYPWYAGECFEKRVDSYMRNHDLLRLMNKKVSYVHRPIPKKRRLRIEAAVKRMMTYPGNRFREIVKRIKELRGEQPPLIEYTPAEAAEISLYRKKIKIYDVFTFFNELELLEIRLNMLAPHVDHFVIIESAETFSGLPKKLIYQENADRFKKFHDKIIHFVITDIPKDEADLRSRLNKKDLSPLDREIINFALSSDNVPKGAIHWLKEFFQKETIQKALTGLNNDDVCYISDVDEIWNPETIVDYRQDDIFKLRQNVHPYFFNNRSSEPWAGTLVTKYKNIKHNCLNHLRTVSKTKYTYIENGGWHFTNQGGADRIRTKLESYGHQEFNNETIKSDLENKIRENRDFIGRGFTLWTDEDDLPSYIKNNKKKYEKFFAAKVTETTDAGDK